MSSRNSPAPAPSSAAAAAAAAAAALVPTRAQKRSWAGCARCKKRRQKCDEQRPACGRCQSAGADCAYHVNLRWGGRSFSQSVFGTCIAESADKVKKLGDAGNFIYVSNPHPQAPVANRSRRATLPLAHAGFEATEPPDESTSVVPTASHRNSFSFPAVPSLQYVDPYHHLSPLDKSLLNHFITAGSHVISCHSIVQKDVCKAVIPAALGTPTLFYATMALAAIHQKSHAGMASSDVRKDPLVAGLLSQSLRKLQQDLLERDAKKSSVLLATIRTLFLCEVHSGGDRPGTWRAHFEGAKALIKNIESWKGYSDTHRDSTAYFMRRWYNMTESFVALTSDGLASGQLARFEPTEPRSLAGDEDQIFLDEYAGFTTDLTSVFCEIGAAAWERRRARSSADQPTILDDDDLDEEAAYLEQSIWQRIERNQTEPPRFRPGLEDKLSERQKADFVLCNEAWQFMALIYIHRQISGLPTSSQQVQYCVRRILSCVEQITASPGLTPLVVLTTPLFVAGCETMEPDRDRVRALLLQMFSLFRIPNVYRSLEVLESFWASPYCGEAQDWDSFMRAQHWDFLPY